MDLEDIEVEATAVAEDLPNFRLHSSEFDEEIPAESPQSDVIESKEKTEIAPSYAIPEVVKSFIVYFYRQFREQNIYEIHSIYEHSFNKLTEKYFKTTSWPPADAIASLVNNDSIFLLLYKELYFRHLYSKLVPTLQQRIDSWNNYVEFFDLLLKTESDLQLELDLPSQWLWDIIDEFIYQFQSFCQYRSKLKNKSEEELALLKVWTVTGVLGYLHGLVNKSHILAYLEREQQGLEPLVDDISAHPVYRMLGYFSIVGLLRMHCLMGDYWLALKTLDPIDLSKKGLYSRVTSCQITLYYYMGFAYLMMRRYMDAIKTFCNILLYIARTKQYHTRSCQYEMILKKNDQMYLLLALAVALCPQRIDENVHNVLKEKHADKMARIQRGEAIEAEELYFAFPKFISPAPPNYDDSSVNTHQEVLKQQTKAILSELAQQVKENQLPAIRSYLKLYTTIPVAKLASFLDVEESVLRQLLMCFKHKTHSVVWTSGSPLSGKYVSTSDVDFYIDLDMIHIADTKVTRRYGEFFLRHIQKFSEITRNLDRARPAEVAPARKF